MNKPAVLARANELVQPALQKAVATLDASIRLPVEYHFGWVEPNGTPVRASGGKGLRPALAVLGAEAVGGDASLAVPGAVAVELVHNFALIHDDIIDHDRTRRHRRTVWDIWGVDDAIIIGDAVHTLAFQALLEEGSPVHIEALRRFSVAVAAMINGQTKDMALDRHNEVTLAQCIDMEADKTGALLAAAIGLGAVLAGADTAAVDALERYGIELGIAFQAVDDLLGIWGDPSVTGKPVGNDLRMRKKSMPVAIVLEQTGPLTNELLAAFSGDMTDDVIASLSDRLETEGIREQVGELAQVHLDRALAALAEQPFAPATTAELTELAQFVLERTA